MIWDPKETIESVGLGKRERKRSDRVADAVRKELSLLFLQKVRDEKLSDVTITTVHVTADLKNANVFYITHGDEIERKQVAKALKRASGFVRSHLAKIMNLRYTPSVQFEYDTKAEKVEALDKIFAEIAHERKSDAGDTETD